MDAADSTYGRPGDLIVISAHRSGGHEQVAEITEVIGEGAHTHYRVRWDEEHESIYFPGPDATIRRAHAQS